jgi:hypothetical protein
MRNNNLAMVIVICIAVVFVTVIGANLLGEVQAAPAAQVTPVASAGYPNGASFVASAIENTTVITLDTGGSRHKLGDAAVLGLHLTVDMHPTLVNTITVRFQHYNEVGQTWVTGQSVSAISADSNTFAQYTNQGMWTRLYFDVTNTNPVTITHASLHVRR